MGNDVSKAWYDYAYWELSYGRPTTGYNLPHNFHCDNKIT